MERHAVSRLIGAPPGYVGFDQGGLLTDALLENPRSVVLLDEIEKAHSDLFNILLQVMDSGQLTDNNGRKADFRNAVLIMTSNAGARQLSKGSIGFGGRPGAGLAREALERAFSPEFRNRLDAMIDFEPLSQDVMSRIVDKMIDELRAQLKSRKVDLCMTLEATAWLANRGYDPAFGARPLGRLIDQELRQQLADDLLFGALVDGGKVTVTVEKERLKIVNA
jgi:ATP-dependent Clp protease ATP-binding subunit ClpA